MSQQPPMMSLPMFRPSNHLVGRGRLLRSKPLSTRPGHHSVPYNTTALLDRGISKILTKYLYRHPKKSKRHVTTMNSTDVESSVQPTDTINAPERHPIPRFSLINEVEYEIKNHPILEEVAKKYNTATENPPVPDT